MIVFPMEDDIKHRSDAISIKFIVSSFKYRIKINIVSRLNKNNSLIPFSNHAILDPLK